VHQPDSAGVEDHNNRLGNQHQHAATQPNQRDQEGEKKFAAQGKTQIRSLGAVVVIPFHPGASDAEVHVHP
jgi:hypothetical protein